AEAMAAPAGYDRDRELRSLLVDEPVTLRVRVEEAVPGRTDGEALVECDHCSIPRSAPVLDVAHRMQSALVLGAACAPVVGVAEHVAKEARVLRGPGPDHGLSC